MPDSPVTGVQVENVTIAAHPPNVNVHFADVPHFHTEEQRKTWLSRQVAVHTTALIGDPRFGVVGLVDRVNAQRLWLIILTAIMFFVVILLIYLLLQVSQINSVLHQLQQLIQRMP